MSENKKPRKFVILKKIFMIIGIITTIFLVLSALLIAYLIIKKPLGINVSGWTNRTEATYDHPLLSSSQEKALQTLGVDLSSVPTSITAAQEKCAVQALGQERVNKIKSGEAPSISDYLKAKSCF